MEQNMFCQSLIHKLRIGYYSGDPLKLVEDCQILKPIFFASVPRLWTRIYQKVKDAFDQQTGCKKWLIDTAVASKLANLNATGSVHSACYDALVFNKVA